MDNLQAQITEELQRSYRLELGIAPRMCSEKETNFQGHSVLSL